MAVQARHDLAQAAGGSLFFSDEYAGCVPARVGDATTTVLRNLAWCNNYGFLPRKRPRLEAAGLQGQVAPAAGGDLLEDQRVGMPPAGMERLLPVPPFVDARSRAAVGSGAASTSGRMANGATTTTTTTAVWRDDHQLLSSWTHRHGVEIDALVRLEAERMRAALQDARRRHDRALLAAVGRAASVRRLRAAESGRERALRRNAELEEKARQAGVECQAWMGVARTHEAVTAGLRAALDQLLLLQSSSPCAGGASGGEAEDAQSCCFDFEQAAPAAASHATEEDGGGASRSRSRLACKSCGGGEACVLLLPCRHLCLCRACEAAVAMDVCPVCASTKNGSLHVLFS